MNVILFEPGSCMGSRVRATGRQAAHLRQVLRVTPGDEVRIGIVDGQRGLGRVVTIDEDGVDLECTFEAEIPPRPPVDLVLALPRPKVLRRLFAPLASLGIARLLLTNAAVVERQYFDTHVLAPATYRPLLVEGLEQARDTRLPEVTVHRRFRPLVEDSLAAWPPDTQRIVAHPGPGAGVYEQVRTQAAARVLLAVGPEGGWSDFELQLLAANGFRQVTLGTRSLRSDTACVALLALVHAALGQPRGAVASIAARTYPTHTDADS